MSRTLRLAAISLALTLAACGGDSTATSVTTTAGGTTLGDTSSAGATTTTLGDVEYPLLVPDLGVPTIEQVTPIAGGGFRPILEWVAVEDAAVYLVAVQAPDGRLYWAWRTEETSVPVGGWPRLEEDAFGPAVATGMTWSVIALDETGELVAISAVRPIAP